MTSPKQRLRYEAEMDFGVSQARRAAERRISSRMCCIFTRVLGFAYRMLQICSGRQGPREVLANNELCLQTGYFSVFAARVFTGCKFKRARSGSQTALKPKESSSQVLLRSTVRRHAPSPLLIFLYGTKAKTAIQS